MKKLMIFILLAGVGYLFYTNPTREAHLAALTDELVDRQVIPAGEVNPVIFSDLDYFNFFIGSSLKDTEKMEIISYGYLGRVKIADDEWKPKRLH